jgi:AraC-like DNA-binding protein
MFDSRDIGFARLGAVVNADAPPRSDNVHPLVHVRTLVDALVKDNGSPGWCSRLMRAALLQALYSFPSPGQLLEQLRYNALYRGFVGLRGDELPWDDTEYASALVGLRSDPAGEALFRRVVLEAHAYAALIPSRFRVDASLVQRWSAVAPRTAEQTERRSADSTRASRLDRAHAVILRRIADPTLDADAIAGELFMSRRALYLMFERHGLTPSRAVREVRLDCCMRLLRDERHSHRKITDIAIDHGFVHFASFSRQFKQRYGVSPSTVRGARQLAGGPRRVTAVDHDHAAGQMGTTLG